MSIIKTARIALDLSQAGMAAWIAKETGKPCHSQQVSDWERGQQPRAHVRAAVAPVAARYVAKHISAGLSHAEAAKLIEECMK